MLSAVQSRGARPLTYEGGDFVISGRITGTSTSALLTIDSATVRLTHNNNTYVSPTTVLNNGTLIVANTLPASSATGTGTVTVEAGSSLKGAGYVQAGLDNSILIHGLLHVGDPSFGVSSDLDLVTSGAGLLFFGDSSVLTLGLWDGAGLGDNSANSAASDLLRIGGALEIMAGATLKLSNPNNLTSWSDGDVFKLFDWAGLTSRTDNFIIDDTDLNLTDGLSIDLTHLYSLGTIAFIVPEPGRALLLGLALWSVVLRRFKMK